MSGIPSAGVYRECKLNEDGYFSRAILSELPGKPQTENHKQGNSCVMATRPAMQTPNDSTSEGSEEVKKHLFAALYQIPFFKV